MSKKNQNTKKNAPKKSLWWGILSTFIVMAVVLGLRGLGDKPDSDFTYSTGGNGTTQTDNNGGSVLGGNKDKDSGALDTSAVYYADIVIRDYGTVTVKLDQSAAPKTVENFVSLAQSGFYDGLTFHRIMANFMMQGGDPRGDGYGGSDKNIVGEFDYNGHHNPISHKRGVISMARANDFNSASSQFFIVHQDSIFLDGQYAAFGYVTEGMSVVDAVCADARPIDGNGTIPSAAQPVMEKVTIRTEK